MSPFDDSMITDADIFQVLRKFNPWWTLKHFCSFPFRRVAFADLYHWFSIPGFRRAVVISGARRVGKTVLLHQLVEQLITDSRDPRTILYLSLDHPILKLAGLDRSLSVYRQNVLPGPSEVVLLLDEIQYVRDWGTWIKHAVDFDPNLRIVATGSAALDIQQIGEESGTGRWVTIKLPTLSFYEFLAMKGIDLPELPPDLRILNLERFSPKERADLIGKTVHLQDYFHRYLLLGGFPELIALEDLEDAYRLLREDVVDKVLKRDMTSSFSVRNVLELEKLFIFICLHSGGLFDKKTVATQLELSAPTVERFLRYLESANLIYRLWPIRDGGKLVLKGRPKVYVGDVSLRNAVLMKGEEFLADSTEMGRNVESAVFKHFQSFYYHQRPIMGYWRSTGRKPVEVDLILQFPTRIVPVEVKYKERVIVTRKDGLSMFSKKAKVNKAICVCKRPDDLSVETIPEGMGVLLKIPAYLLLFLLGHVERGLWDV